MIEVEELDGGLRVVDGAKNEVGIEIEGWERGGEELEIDRNVDDTIVGKARAVAIPGQSVVIESSCRSGLCQLQIGETRHFPKGVHIVQIDQPISTYIRVDKTFEINLNAESNTISIIFDGMSPMTLGFRSHEELPVDALHVPQTIQGLAAAISRFGDVHRTGTPDRSYPSMRGHPPLVKFDDGLCQDDLPPANNPITFRLPKSLELLFAVSPLAYYIGATVMIESRERPVMEVDGYRHVFAGADSFPVEISEWQSRVFYLDCLVRNAGPNGIDMMENALLDQLPFDPNHVFSLSISDRLIEYLKVPFDRISSELPDWPLSVSVDPTIRNGTVLPYLANRMCFIFPPKPKKLGKRTILQQSITGLSRTASVESSSTVLEEEQLIEPTQESGAMRGWIADGVSVDAFNCPPESFSNRAKYFDVASPLSILVIQNENEMGSEFSDVLDVYHERKNSLSLTVDSHHSLATDELKTLLERPHDFLHYIGHCDTRGLQCRDGYLSLSDISECNIQTFFLNACQSYKMGVELVRRGSVAGAVTIADVINEQAVKVGETFSRLICSGHSIAGALWVARRRAIMNRNYTVVGDGTHTLSQGRHIVPSISEISKISEEEYRVCSDSRSPKLHGAICQSYTSKEAVLVGNDDEHFVSGDDLEWYLTVSNGPCVYQDKFYWPEELLEELF